MSSPLSVDSPASFFKLLQLPEFIACLFTAILIGSILNYNRKSDLPHINPPKTFGLRITKRNEFYKDGMNIINAAVKKFKNKPYRMLTTLGEVVVLPPRYGGIIRNSSELSFRKAGSMVRETLMGLFTCRTQKTADNS